NRRISCCLSLHVRCVDVGVHVLEADRHATEAHSLTISSLGRQLEDGRPHGLLPAMERTIVTILLEVGLGTVGEKDAPCSPESATRVVEALGKAACALCQITAGIEGAAPLPTSQHQPPVRDVVQN